MKLIYESDGRTAVIKGEDAVPLRFKNSDFYPAVRSGRGNFEAWVIPADSPWLEFHPRLKESVQVCKRR